jgi:hypothetical protein
MKTGANNGHALRLVAMMALLFVWLSATATNPIWTTIDKRMIKQLARLDYTNPAAVAEHFSESRNGTDEKEIQDLGFGWKMWHTGIGGGYVAVMAEFYYFQDSIVAYEVVPQMPTEHQLKARYRKWYATAFSFEGDVIQPRQHNMRSLEEPLPQYSGVSSVEALSDSVRAYLSPACGTRYGFRGGYSNTLTANRACLKSFREKVDDNMLLLMMYSINPATRLTAIEYYYYRMGHEFGANAEVDAWVLLVFTEVPRVRIAMGCIVETMTAHEAVALFGSFTEEWYEEK